MQRTMERVAFSRATDVPHERPWRSAVVVGRIALGAIFVLTGISKVANWDSSLAYMDAHGISAAGPVLLALAVIAEVVGGLSIMTGTFARPGALLLAVYLVPVTLLFHAFWNQTGVEYRAELSSFLKNLSMFGGLLILAGYGAGRVSVDQTLKRRLAPERPDAVAGSD